MIWNFVSHCFNRRLSDYIVNNLMICKITVTGRKSQCWHVVGVCLVETHFRPLTLCENAHLNWEIVSLVMSDILIVALKLKKMFTKESKALSTKNKVRNLSFITTFVVNVSRSLVTSVVLSIFHYKFNQFLLFVARANFLFSSNEIWKVLVLLEVCAEF